MGALRSTPYLLLAVPVIFLLIFFLIPLGIALVFSFFTNEPSAGMRADLTFDNYAKVFTTPVYMTLLVRTLRLSMLTMLATLPIAYVLAYWLVRLDPRWRVYAMFGIVVALWSSVVVRAFAWMILLSDSGVVNSSLEALGIPTLRLMYNQTGTIVGLVHVMVPIMFFPIYASLKAIDPSLEHAAEGLGASPLRRFWRVTLPLSTPGIVSGSLLVFIIVSGFFLIPVLLGGGRVLVIASVVVQQVGLLNYPFAGALSIILLLVVLLVAFVVSRIVARGRIEGGIFGA
ncbi:MAG: ABC transporter permease [Acidimicrobiia bacterium]|nr:MAG: ABC transporter permease [Acidimicrobiia bacterium]